jgi:hypothetical protein
MMETKVSKAQIEVWEWKEALYEELRDIPKLERLNYIKGRSKIILTYIPICQR